MGYGNDLNEMLLSASENTALQGFQNSLRFIVQRFFSGVHSQIPHIETFHFHGKTSNENKLKRITEPEFGASSALNENLVLPLYH